MILFFIVPGCPRLPADAEAPTFAEATVDRLAGKQPGFDSYDGSGRGRVLPIVITL